MNLERNSKRTAEISKLLFDTYKSEIKFKDSNTISVSFSKNATIDPKNIKIPFGIGIYEKTLMLSLIGTKEININTLDSIRTNFVDNYFTNNHDKRYPNLLFSYQKKIKEAGMIDAYNHWILMKGDEDGFEQWHTVNNERWEDFVKWFTDNPLKIDDKNKFYSGQY